jgi:hypothetical protein
METFKKCNTCNEQKEINLFVIRSKEKQTYKNICKSCHCKNECEKRKNNNEKYKQKDKLNYEKHKETILEKNKIYRNENKDRINSQKKDYYNNNRDKILEYHRNNTETRNIKRKIRYKNDCLFRIQESLKARIHDVLKNIKEDKTNKLIGCSKSELKEWLEYQFNNDINWDNYGIYWHIDHVIPINFFKVIDKEEQLICFNWTNLRPLHKKENISKSDKIKIDDILKHIDMLKMFPQYQANYENSWWRRIELRYGNNLKDEEDFINLLKWAIRSQAPKLVID